MTAQRQRHHEEVDLIEEARAAGKAYIESFKGDDKALLEDIHRREALSGHPVVSLPPKPPRARPPAAQR